MLDRLLAFALVVGVLLAVGAAMKDEAVEADPCHDSCEDPAPLLHEPSAPEPRASLPPPVKRASHDEDDEREEKREKEEKRKGEDEEKGEKKGKGGKRGRGDD